jgi:hypothetical protein
MKLIESLAATILFIGAVYVLAAIVLAAGYYSLKALGI